MEVFLCTKVLFVFKKRLQIMSVRIIFQGKEDSATEKHELECYQVEDKILIFIKDSNSPHDYAEQFIELDKYTAIKFSRELRKQIALIQQS